MDCDIEKLSRYTVEEFQENFDALMKRIERGEFIIIKDGDKSVIVVPFEDTP